MRLPWDMNQFKVNKNKSLLFGLFTFAIPLTIGFPVCFYLLGYDFNASFLTASMFATHTLIAYPIVSSMGVSKNEAVAITVGGTILTDTAVLITLAVILGNAQQGGLTTDFWIKLVVSLTVFIAIMFLVVPRIAKWFFTKMEKEKHSHYIFVLTVMFFAAFLAELAGVEDIIGAFLAGLALNRLIPHSSALMNRIEFMGNSLFIPIFLISVGMLVDIRVILSGYMAIFVAITLSVVAISGKWLAAFFTQLVFKYSTSQRKVIFGLSSGHAAATLAVIIVGYNAEIIDINILNGTIILILITSIVATLATENAAKMLVSESRETDAEEIKKSESFKMESILLPLANLTNLEKLLELSILIKDKASVNPVSILTVVPNDEEAEINIAKAKNKLDEYVKQATAADTEVEITTTIDEEVAHGIYRKSRELIADLIILGWPKSTQGTEDIMGGKMGEILEKTTKTTFICDVIKPWETHQRMIVAATPHSEKAEGFQLWVKKLVKLSGELSIPIIMNCTPKTQNAIEKLIKVLKIKASLEFRHFMNWDDFLILSKDMIDDDIFVLISAKKGTKNYQRNLHRIPNKLNEYFKEFTKILIYPN
jgi:Kef-type K+ transport system membrane component KefB